MKNKLNLKESKLNLRKKAQEGIQEITLFATLSKDILPANFLTEGIPATEGVVHRGELQGILVQAVPYTAPGYIVVEFRKRADEIYIDADEPEMSAITELIEREEIDKIWELQEEGQHVPFGKLLNLSQVGPAAAQRSDYSALSQLYGAYVTEIRPEEIVNVWELPVPKGAEVGLDELPPEEELGEEFAAYLQQQYE